MKLRITSLKINNRSQTETSSYRFPKREGKMNRTQEKREQQLFVRWHDISDVIIDCVFIFLKTLFN